MKKRVVGVLGIVIIALLILQISLIRAEENATGYDLGYECLKSEIETKGVSNLIAEELAFSLLAMSYDSDMKTNLKTALDSKKSSTESCWPSTSCTIKDTALALLALDYIGENTESIEYWLLNQTTAPRDLIWFLEIDQTGDAEGMQCEIKYKNSTKVVTVDSDKKISGNTGSCLTIAYDGYWLEIDNNCFNDEFEVSCDDDFVTALLYKKRDSSTFYVSSLTHTGIAQGSATEQVSSLCFKRGGASCDYEGSLWATLALNKVGREINAYTPYLVALSSDNSRYLPSAFLYMVLGYDEYYNELISAQKPDGYWQTVSGKRYYDTALALLALQNLASEQASEAETYLLEGQPEDGCWASIRDTAMLLYSASPRDADDEEITIANRSDCEEFSYFCVQNNVTCTEAGGEMLDNFYCSSWSRPVCCSQQENEETCDEQGGVICAVDEECQGTRITASDTGSCCLNGVCTEEVVSPETDCEIAGGTCKTNCADNEEEKTAYSDSCTGIEKCCSAKGDDEGFAKYWWIWLLVLLIVIAVVIILFKDKLRDRYYSVKDKFSKTPPPANNKPPMAFHPGPPMQRLPPPRQILQQRPPLPPRRMPPSVQFSKERELSNTLRKLKEIGKR